MPTVIESDSIRIAPIAMYIVSLPCRIYSALHMCVNTWQSINHFLLQDISITLNQWLLGTESFTYNECVNF